MSISQVLPHLYVSDCLAAQSESILAGHNIKRILSVTKRDENLPPSEICQKLGIRTKVFRIDDIAFVDEEEILTRDIFPWVRKAIDSREVVLVHCRLGLSRSPSLIVAYLVWRGMSFNEAWEFVREKHPDINPWLDTMESFLQCVGANIPEEHKDRSGERERVK